MSEVEFSPGIVPGSTLTFPAGQTAPTVKQADVTTGNGAPLTIQAQTTSAATSVGGKLVLKSGTGTVATGGQQANGEIELMSGNTSIGTYLTRVGGDTRFTLNSSLPYCVFAANGSNQFWDFQATSGQVFFDAVSMIFRDSSSTEAIRITPSSTSTNTLQFAVASTPIITQSTRTSDASIRNIEIKSQAPFATAVTNTSSGSIILTAPAPVSTGEYGAIIHRYGDANTQVLRKGAKGTTTDATQTTVGSHTLADSTLVNVRALVLARSAAGGNHATYEIKAAVRRHAGGAATIIGTVDAATSREEAGAAAWDVTLDVSGNDVRVRVTGAAATTVTWFTTLEINSLTV